MLEKIKKNKLPLFLLALVMMLSVYYVSLENKNDIEKPVGNLDAEVTTRYQKFAEGRISILTERDQAVLELEEKISTASVSLTDVETYVEEIERITSLTEQEVYMESLIMGMGYEDALVHLKETNNLTISVIADDFDVNDYITLAKTAKNEFGTTTLVTVNVVNVNDGE